MNPVGASATFDPFFVARQPIFDNANKVWGYELLFRSAPGHETAQINDEDLATICVATCGFIKAQEDTDLNKKICINFTENLILQGVPRGLPPTVTVIEVLENIEPSPQIIEAIIKLKQEGYLFAIDDYVGDTNIQAFIELADIVKVDILGMDFDQIDRVYATIKDFKGLKVAEKVDHLEVLKHLKQLGFDLYQGYYFAKPENLKGRKLKSTSLSKLRILQQIEDPTVSTEKIIEMINTDPSITYRLLRLLNTAAFGFSMKINSVRHAVMLLGNRRLKYWLRMVVLSDLIAEKKTPELYVTALTRGRFLEEMAVGGQIISGLGLTYGTTHQQMQAVLEGLERVLRDHPKIWPDAVVVKFKEFGASSLDIEVMAWFQVPTWAEFQACRQEVLLRFMRIVEESGSSFAFPTRTVHLVQETATAQAA